MKIENTGEGILPLQIEAVRSLTRSIESNGARASCVIAFGSRATGTAKSESDLDVFFLIDFDAGDSSILSDENLRRTKHVGQATTGMSGPAGDIYLFLYNQGGFAEKLFAYTDIQSSRLFTGIAYSGLVIHGEEPIIEGKTLIQYLNERLKQ